MPTKFDNSTWNFDGKGINILAPGHFRIGFETLQIPPTDITTNKVNNDEQLATLRTTTPMFVKTGQARWDVTVRWKAIIKGDDFSQWEQLRNIVAMFRVAPFVEVENDYLRQILTNIQEGYKTQRMAFAMKQIRIDTDPNTTALDITLTMTLFNFAPYSTEFGYVDDNGASVDASKSPKFITFIKDWVKKNMDTHPGMGKSTPNITPWLQQFEGDLSFLWRRYRCIPFDPVALPPANASTVGYSAPTAPASKSVPKMKPLSVNVQALINNIAPNYGLDPGIVTALCYQESNGNPNAGSNNIGRSGVGLMQLTLTTARGLGLGITRENILDPTLNISGGCKYLATQLKTFGGNYAQALAAYNVGPGIVKSYRDGIVTVNNPRGIKSSNGLPPAGADSMHPQNTPAYVNAILSNAGKSNLLPISVTLSTTGEPPFTKNDAKLLTIADPKYRNLVSQAFDSLPAGTWFWDHYTEYGTFFYEEEKITLPGPESPLENTLGLYPYQLSLVLVNNLPQIPLAGMQYPTYQHVGPCDTMASIALLSVGGDSEVTGEPEHFGLEKITGMAATLDTQFQQLRTSWRAVSSVHMMQAVFVENQILNMLGIAGVMLRGINTESIPDSANQMQVSVMLSQYENVFEETPPFRMNGLDKAYVPVVKNMLTSGILDNLSPDEQKAYAIVKEFSDKWQAKDPQYLFDQILVLSGSINPLQFMDNTPQTGIWNAERDALFQTTTMGSPTAGLTGGSSQGVTYPGLAQRRKQLEGTTQEMLYSDYFVFSKMPSQSNPTLVNILKVRIDAQFASQKTAILDSMYQSLYNLKLQADPIFSLQLGNMTQSPTFRDIFLSAANSKGPMSDPSNGSHICYKDLGLTDYRQGPTDYFVNNNLELVTSVHNNLTAALGTTTATAADANAVPGSSANPQFTGTTIPGAADSISRMSNIPAYSMASAFPTFKLLLIEEDNSGPFFAFDNFSSYASVIDMEVIKYADKPDMAIIQITNLAHLLQHRLYDDTAAGKIEYENDRTNVSTSVTGGPNPTPTTGGNPNAAILQSNNLALQGYQLIPRKNMTEGVGESTSRIPAQFFALQTGSKIQVRMGYSNNPDVLFPVFTGQVTEIQGDEILTITCQSFMLELMTTPGIAVSVNDHLGFNFFSGGAAFGDLQLSNSGDTGSVISKLILAKPARHFGHWQIGVQTDPMTKGFTWAPLQAALASAAGSAINSPILSKVGALLQNQNDRSGENILINSIINFDGTNGTASGRGFDDERPFPVIFSTKYSIPQQCTFSIWELIKDVGRRLPFYNLLIKDYGFPYAADATLIYAHPLDWYYYRPPLFGEAEKEKINNATHGPLFSAWWASEGRAEFQHALDLSINDINNRAGLLISTVVRLGTGFRGFTAADFGSVVQEAGSSPESFTNILEEFRGLAAGTISSDSTTGSVLAFLSNHFVSLLKDTFGGMTNGAFQDIDRNLQAVSRAWLSHLATSDPAANTSRIKPVRKYHFVDYNHIIHNGITLNDNMYNGVMMESHTGNDIFKINENIPDQHMRILNVHDLMNDPKENVYPTEAIKVAYGQSFLREEAGKMYRGELVLRGIPEIEPMDVILMMDTSTGIIGPIEVESVIHSFSIESGYITIVKPRLLLVVNEESSVNIIRALANAISEGVKELIGVGNGLIGPSVGVPGAPGINAARVGAVGAVAVAGGAELLLGTIWTPPTFVLVLAAALLGGLGILAWKDSNIKRNLFKLMPLSKFGRPWLGGLQGFRISDFNFTINRELQTWLAEEISPTIESWELLKLHYQTDYTQTP